MTGGLPSVACLRAQIRERRWGNEFLLFHPLVWILSRADIGTKVGLSWRNNARAPGHVVFARTDLIARCYATLVEDVVEWTAPLECSRDRVPANALHQIDELGRVSISSRLDSLIPAARA